MIVYRMEHEETGVGPYNADSWKADGKGPRDLSDAHSWHDDSHPGTHEDFEPLGLYWMIVSTWAGNYRHACPTLAGLREWFGEWEPILRRAGFTIRAYDVPDKDVLQGLSGLQVVFETSKATMIEEVV